MPIPGSSQMTSFPDRGLEASVPVTDIGPVPAWRRDRRQDRGNRRSDEVIIVAGHFAVDPGQREQFLRSRLDVTRTSRSEAGCIAYAFSPDPLDPGRVLLFERWEDKAALAGHLAALRQRPRPQDSVDVLESEIRQYEISAVGPVGS
jgi:quinol monooxygenase YgiN